MSDGVFGLVVREAATGRVFWGDKVRRVDGGDPHGSHLPSIQVRDRWAGFEEDWHTVALGGPETYDLRQGWAIVSDPFEQARAVCGDDGALWVTAALGATVKDPEGSWQAMAMRQLDLARWFQMAIGCAEERGDCEGVHAKIVEAIRRPLHALGVAPASDRELGIAAAMEIGRLRVAREHEPSREELLEAFRELSDMTAFEVARALGKLDAVARDHVLRTVLAETADSVIAQALHDSGDARGVVCALRDLGVIVAGDGERIPPAPDPSTPIPEFDAFDADPNKWADAFWEEFATVGARMPPNLVRRWFHAAMEVAANRSPAIAQYRRANERLTRRLEDTGVLVAGDAELTPEEVEGLRKAWARAQGDNADPAPLSDTEAPKRWQLMGNRLHSEGDPDSLGIFVDTDPSWAGPAATETLNGYTWPVPSESIRMTRTGLVFVQVASSLPIAPCWVRASPLFYWLSEAGRLESERRRELVRTATDFAISAAPDGGGSASVANEPPAWDATKPFGGAIPFKTIGAGYSFHRPYHPNAPIELVHAGGSIWASGYNQIDDEFSGPVVQGLCTAHGMGLISFVGATYAGEPTIAEAGLYAFGRLVGVLVSLEVVSVPFRDGMGAFRYAAFLENTTPASETVDGGSPDAETGDLGDVKAKASGRWEVRSTPVRDTPSNAYTGERTFDAPPGEGWEPFGGNGGSVLWRRWESA